MQLKKQLEASRERLLDLTLRNRLLNFRPLSRSIKLPNHIPSELFESLVLKEEELTFKAHAENKSDSDSFYKALYAINQKSRTILEEQGYPVLYLALGFLNWHDGENKEKINLAPLILIPVELERQKDRTKYKLKWSGLDIVLNLSLEAKLFEYSVSLPTIESLEEPGDIDAFFQDVIEAISTKDGWKVTDDIVLDMFSFTKFVMYKDLDPELWDINHHPLLELALSGSENEGFAENKKNNVENMELPSESVYHVMDADSSQIAVIEAVKTGQNLVVEGPPGTGKSQTITNLIAEVLVHGKKVLFVSEKMAALEVVKSRLDKVGLGNFCLELHSHKSNKKEVLQELERAISSSPNNCSDETEKYSRVDNLKKILNDYVNTLHSPIADTERTPFELLTVREKAKDYFKNNNLEMPRVWFPHPSSWNIREWRTAIQTLENLTTGLSSVTPISEHPWRGCSTGIISTQYEEDIFQKITDFQDAIEKVLDVLCILEKEFGIRVPENSYYLDKHLRAADIVENAFPVDTSVLLNEKWDSFNDEAKELINMVESIAEAKKKFTRAALTIDPILKVDISYIMKLTDEYEDYSYLPKWKRGLSWKYHRKVKKPISSLYQSTMPEKPSIVRADLKKLAECVDIKEKMEWGVTVTETIPSLFGKQWNGEDSQPEHLKQFGEWIVKFREYLRDGTLTENAVDIASKATFNTTLNSIKNELEATLRNFRKKREILFNTLNTNSNLLFGINEDEVRFEEYQNRISLWIKERPQLRIWGQFSSREQACRQTIAAPLLDHLEKLNPNDIVPCFEANLAESLLEELFLTSPILGDFIGEEHQNKITEFKHLDSQCIELNQHRLAFQLQKRQPNFFAGASAASEMGILQGQFNRKRGHMPIRKLLSATGGLIQRIKPCFMMSPLSVAQYCDPTMIQFDVIVFDEASQIRPEDALGTLLRAKQAVVIGDTRQLPPTSFFDHIVEETDIQEADDETVSIVDVESILHQCRQRFPIKQLKWHYRSRHESLIAISNQEFYQNKLLIFPSPIDKAENLGLQFKHIPQAVYDRGNTSTNPIEAEVVVDAVFEHFQKYPDKSLGVGTFNMKQQQLILDQVEKRLDQNPKMNAFFSRNRGEHFFVKNLETIQGDERDCIFLSIGYGKDKDGKLYKNFGPLNHDGGERRLNVLITRAREKCVVFSNFRASDLQLNTSAAFGVRALKMFLDYAEKRNLALHNTDTSRTGSEFEDAVYEFLTHQGHKLKKHVGCAEYRIDLAIVDPDNPKRYLLGIECDGHQYRNAPTARDRDRLRSQVLEGLGWKLYRIWAIDWYRNQETTKKRILEAITEVTTTGEIQTDQINETEPVQMIPNEIKPSSQQIPENNLQIVDYVICNNLKIPIIGELHLQRPALLAEAVRQVVNLESPVHSDQVIHRIRTYWGLARAGAKIKKAIEKGILFAEKNNMIRRKGKFLWRVDDEEITIRKRKNPNIKWICDEEITEAIKKVLSLQGAITPEALIFESVKYFGYKSKGKNIVERIRSIIDKLIENKIVGINQQDMVYYIK